MPIVMESIKVKKELLRQNENRKQPPLNLSGNQLYCANQIHALQNEKIMPIVSALSRLGIPQEQRRELVTLIRSRKWLAEVSDDSITFYKE